MIANKTNTNNKGQSMVEVVFAIGIVGLVVTGAVVLMLNSLSAQTKRFDHKKATELGQAVIEELVSQKNNDPNQFWKLNDVTSPQTLPEFDGYTYTIDYQADTSGGKCVASPASCATAVVNVTWQRDTTKTLILTRFFSRK